jgi:hypothetical protein
MAPREFMGHAGGERESNRARGEARPAEKPTIALVLAPHP